MPAILSFPQAPMRGPQESFCSTCLRELETVNTCTKTSQTDTSVSTNMLHWLQQTVTIVSI